MKQIDQKDFEECKDLLNAILDQFMNFEYINNDEYEDALATKRCLERLDEIFDEDSVILI